MVVDKDKKTITSVYTDTLIRVYTLRRLRTERKKGQHRMETVPDVIERAVAALEEKEKAEG